MRLLGLVTARGGSKRLPGKNLAELAGLPLVTWSLRHLLDLRQRCAAMGIDIEPYLSTEDPAIAAAWPEPWRPGRLRPAALAADDTTSEAVIADALDQVDGSSDGFLLLQPTSPLIGPEDLQQLVAALVAGAPSALLVAPWDHPPQWALAADHAGCHQPLWPDGVAPAAEPYRPAGAWAVSRRQWQERQALVVSGATRLCCLPRDRAVDIDHAEDLATATALRDVQARPSSIDAGTLRLSSAGCCVIAEAGVNHNGDADLAHRLVDAAADAGADAVKFQIFDTDELVEQDARQAAYQERNTGRAQSQAELLRGLELPLSVFARLRDHAHERGIVFLATAFDPGSLQGLLQLEVPLLKVPSGELTNHPLLRRIAAAGLPVLLSTGMATMWEVLEAVRCMEAAGCDHLAVLHCVSSYPTPPEACHLRAMSALRQATGRLVGWSDHTAGTAIAIAAAAAGAVLIEKHLTLDRELPGPDHAASIEPAAFADLVVGVQMAHAARGQATKAPQACEADVRQVARRSLHLVQDLPAGTVLCDDHVCSRRPGDGIAPSELDRLRGRTLGRDRPAGTRLAWEDLA